jgi:hypothetical protein
LLKKLDVARAFVLQRLRVEASGGTRGDSKCPMNKDLNQEKGRGIGSISLTENPCAHVVDEAKPHSVDRLPARNKDLLRPLVRATILCKRITGQKRDRMQKHKSLLTASF